jgi:tetratricopeptide (TPR) repeat protein
MRWLYGADLTPSPALRKVEADCRGLWDRRQALNDLLGAETDPATREQLRTDLLDLAVLGCDLRVRLAGADAAAARQEALRVLAQAEELLGPGPVLRQERRAYAAALGRPELVPGGDDSDPRTAWEHTALGRSFLRAGDFKQAAEHLEQALRLEPQGLWPNFYQGLCLHHFGRYQEALVAFSVCIGAAPESAACFCNRALAYTELGRSAEAIADYDQALRLDAGCGMAALNRGVLHYRAERYDDALADLERAVAAGDDPAAVHYNLALVHLARGERDAALASLERALERDPEHGPARALREQLLRSRDGKPRSS